MAKIDQQELENYLLHTPKFTFADVAAAFLVVDETRKMQIDRTIQKLRRAGKIAFKRDGRLTVWHAAGPKVSPQSQLNVSTND